MFAVSFKSRKPMRWTTDHDVALVREIILHEPWEKRQGSVERGKSWENIAASLNGLTEIQRSKLLKGL